MSAKKRAFQIGLFLVIMLMTFYALFSGRNLREIADAVSLARAAMDIPRPGEEELRCAAYSLKG